MNRSPQGGAALLRRALGCVHLTEELGAGLALAAMALLPLAEIVVRPFLIGGIPGSIPFVQHLTLWVAFLGAGIAARQGKLIALATATFIPEGAARRAAQAFAATVGCAVTALLAWSAIDVVAIEMEIGGEIALGIPSWTFQLVLPGAFAVVALRLAWRAGGWGARAVAAVGLAAGVWLSGTGAACAAGEDGACLLVGGAGWPWVVLVVLAALAGAPIFTVLEGAAVFLYMVDAFDPAAVPLLDAPRRVGDHGQRAQAQEVHLEHARLLERVHVELRDHRVRAGAGVRVDRHVVVERPGRDHDAGRVHRTVTRQSLHPLGVVEQLRDLRILPVEFGEFPHLLPRLGHGEREARTRRDELRELVRVGG